MPGLRDRRGPRRLLHVLRRPTIVGGRADTGRREARRRTQAALSNQTRAMTRRRLPPPRWQTPLPPNVAGSWGPEVAEWARAELGLELDLWQRRALNRALAVDADGRLVHSLYLVSTARQNGKTAAVRSLIGWALTARRTPPWALVLGLASDRAQARIPYEAVSADLAKLASRVGRSRLSVTRYLGIRSNLHGRRREYRYGSRDARDAIRGLSVDLAAFDEVRTQRTMDTWAALEPTMTARPEPLAWAISTAGDERSVLLRQWWELGIAIIEGREAPGRFGMTWYAADDDDDPSSDAALLKANPSAAEGRIPLVAVRGTGTLTGAQWRQEKLNLWSDAADEWLPAGVWRRQEAEQPAEWAPRVVFGVEAVPTWRRATIVVALVTDAGAWFGVAGELDASRTAAATVSPEDLVKLLRELAGAWRPELVTFSAAAAAAPHVQAWAEGAGIAAHGLGPRDIRSASELFRSELVGGRLTHAADPLLDEQARAGRPNSALEAGGWYFSVRDSTGEIDALRASAWAAWGAISPEAPRLAPQVFL